MITIHKYPVKPGVQFVAMPRGARILAVQMQHEVPMLWALVNTDMPMKDRRFEVYGTGHEVHPKGGELGDLLHVGTIQMQGGALVFHVFERLWAGGEF